MRLLSALALLLLVLVASANATSPARSGDLTGVRSQGISGESGKPPPNLPLQAQPSPSPTSPSRLQAFWNSVDDFFRMVRNFGSSRSAAVPTPPHKPETVAAEVPQPHPKLKAGADEKSNQNSAAAAAAEEGGHSVILVELVPELPKPDPSARHDPERRPRGPWRIGGGLCPCCRDVQRMCPANSFPPRRGDVWNNMASLSCLVARDREQLAARGLGSEISPRCRKHLRRHPILRACVHEVAQLCHGHLDSTEEATTCMRRVSSQLSQPCQRRLDRSSPARPPALLGQETTPAAGQPAVGHRLPGLVYPPVHYTPWSAQPESSLPGKRRSQLSPLAIVIIGGGLVAVILVTVLAIGVMLQRRHNTSRDTDGRGRPGVETLGGGGGDDDDDGDLRRDPLHGRFGERLLGIGGDFYADSGTLEEDNGLQRA